MTHLDRTICVVAPLMVAIVAAAQFSGVTLADLRSDVVLRLLASWGVFA